MQQLDHPNVIKYLASFVEDNELNIAKQPAVRKISMLPNVMSQLKKVWPMLIQLC